MPKPFLNSFLLTILLFPAITFAAAPAQAVKDCPDCPEVVPIPAGSFMMGAAEAERAPFIATGGKDAWFDRALPQHLVTISAGLSVGKFEITRKQFAAFIAASNYVIPNGCNVRGADDKWLLDAKLSWRNAGFGKIDNHPVSCVNWDDANAYTKWLSAKTGKNYRLLTEAEWEYAARAGTATAFHTGNTITTSQANFDGEGTFNGSAKGAWCAQPVAVGSLTSPNKFGLHDMHGNVWEWVADCWHGDYTGAPTTGAAWNETDNGVCTKRVLRSGCWFNLPASVRSAERARSDTTYRDIYNGFRVVRVTP
jgi:formylglycine-generating enzyme required for sulfatase activity